ncbi:MAG: peptidase [Rhizobiales bacterium]|nr:peptidase [Hyphomicrobiales bacterium]
MSDETDRNPHHDHFFNSTRNLLSKLGLPRGDSDSMPSSNKTFPDGSNYQFEIPTINSADTLERLLTEASNQDLVINRVTETLGIFRHCNKEISRYVEISKSYNCQLLMSIGPRAPYDTSSSVKTPEGKMMGYRLRGQEQLVRATEDVYRALEVGVRGFVIYDEGLLWVLNELKKSGDIPKETHLKISAHCGHGNPASAKLLETLGANSFNPVRDLSLPMLCAIRLSLSIPLDCHTDNPTASGGFIRFYDVPMFVKMLAPINLKIGNSVLNSHGLITSSEDAIKMLHQVSIVKEFMDRYLPTAIQGMNCTPRTDKEI